MDLPGDCATTQSCHCEPFWGEAISRLSGQLDRLGIASSQRTLPRNDIQNGFDAELNSYEIASLLMEI
jgi:hypothetical protein